MIISFETPELLECCSSLDAAERELGSAHAQALISMIADAEAFDCADDLIKFFGREALVGESDTLSLAIGSDYRAGFVAIGINFVRNADGSVDWTSVRRLKLLHISRCP